MHRDICQAADMTLQAVETGPVMTQNSLSIRVSEGCGVDQDFAVAVDLYRCASDAGYMGAHVNPGRCYEKGKGVSMDVCKAVELYRRNRCRSRRRVHLP